MSQNQAPQQDWIAHALKQAQWRTETQATSLVLAVVVIVVLIGALYLAQASRTSTAGRRVQELEARRQVLEQQNSQLRAEIASLRSIPRLISEAETRGYRVASVEELEYLTLDNVPPPLPITPDQVSSVPGLGVPIASEVQLAVYDETLDSWLTDRTGVFQKNLRRFFSSTLGLGELDEFEEVGP